jgi:hypothetical protein
MQERRYGKDRVKFCISLHLEFVSVNSRKEVIAVKTNSSLNAKTKL